MVDPAHCGGDDMSAYSIYWFGYVLLSTMHFMVIMTYLRRIEDKLNALPRR